MNLSLKFLIAKFLKRKTEWILFTVGKGVIVPFACDLPAYDEDVKRVSAQQQQLVGERQEWPIGGALAHRAHCRANVAARRQTFFLSKSVNLVQWNSNLADWLGQQHNVRYFGVVR